MSEQSLSEQPPSKKRQVKSACQLCPNQCAVTLTVDNVGIVTAAWRQVVAHQGFAQKPCTQLNAVVGMNLQRALRRINLPPLGSYLAGGH
ncbi:MAG: hypothetical protein FWF30_03270 [Coriobacteriia bacterium]|nr:hypothetical protein [Coriobacteriia bacterium]